MRPVPGQGRKAARLRTSGRVSGHQCAGRRLTRRGSPGRRRRVRRPGTGLGVDYSPGRGPGTGTRRCCPRPSSLEGGPRRGPPVGPRNGEPRMGALGSSPGPPERGPGGGPGAPPARGAPGTPPRTPPRGGCTFSRVFNNSPSRDRCWCLSSTRPFPGSGPRARGGPAGAPRGPPDTPRGPPRGTPLKPPLFDPRGGGVSDPPSNPPDRGPLWGVTRRLIFLASADRAPPGEH